jgi:hypothetical protein
MLLAVLIFSAFLSVLAAFILFRRKHLRLNTVENDFLPPRSAVSLFAPSAKIASEIEREHHHRELSERRECILAWASIIEFSSLTEKIVSIEDEFCLNIWTDALEILTERANTNEDVCALVSFVLRNEKLNVNNSIVENFRQIWEHAPDLPGTTKLFLLSARTTNANLFLETLVHAEQFVAAEKINLQHSELYDLAAAHYWLLPSAARTSGAGFLLKQKLADSRRELT